MKLQIHSEELTNELRAIVNALSKRDVPNSNLFSEITARLANVEARIQTLESLLTSKTVAGKIKLSEEGKRVGELWYQK